MAANEPDCLVHNFSYATRRRLMVLAMAAVVLVSADAAKHAGRVHDQRVGLAGFVAPLSSSAVCVSFRREDESLRAMGESARSPGGVRDGGAHRVFPTSTAVWGVLSGLQQEWEGDHGRQDSSKQQSVVRLLQLRSSLCSRRASSSLLVHTDDTVEAEIPGEVLLPGVVAVTKTEQTAHTSSGGEESTTSVEGKETTVIITKAGGRPHTMASKAKISAANKGKVPWNTGVGHSEETRRKIAEGARNAARKRRLKVAESLGMTLEAYEEMKRRKPVGKRDTRVTEETKRKISARLRAKWKEPGYRQRRKMVVPSRQGVLHSEETKARISAAVKKKWNDPEYRQKITSVVRSEETRAKIGKTIREQWANPVTREERMRKIPPRSKEHNQRIADTVRIKWSDPEFRQRTVAIMRKAAYDRVIASGGVPTAPRVRRPRVPHTPGDSPRIEGVGISREAQRNLNKWAKQRTRAESRLVRKTKRDEKAREAATKLAIKEAKAEAERIALEEEAALTEGLDDLEKVLLRSTIRAKKQQRLEAVAKAVAKATAKAKADAVSEEVESEEPEEQVQVVPDGFEMVEINGRKALRMK